MVNRRKVYINDSEIYLTWVDKDQHCFPIIIIEDWQKYSNVIWKYVKNFDAVLQAGGNCGLYPLLYSKGFKKVYTL